MPGNDKIKEIFSRALSEYEAEADERLWHRIEQELHPKKRRMIFYWAAAAALLLAILIPSYFIRRSGDEKKLANKTDKAMQNKHEIVPGKKSPIFTPRPPEGGIMKSPSGDFPPKADPPLAEGVDKDEAPKNIIHKENPAPGKEGILQSSDKAILTLEYSKEIITKAPEPEIHKANDIIVPDDNSNEYIALTESRVKPALADIPAMNILHPELKNPAGEQLIRTNTVFPETSPVLIPSPDYSGWLASANILSSSGLSAGGGDPFTFTIPNSGDIIVVHSFDTTGRTIARTTTWNQEIQQTSIGYIPVSLATTTYDTAYLVIQTTDTIRTPDKEGNATPGDIKYGLPVMTGISFSYRLNKHWAVGTGISYSIFTAGQEISYSDNTYEKINSKLQYAGIPVHVAYYFISKKHLVTYVSAGSSFEWNISDKSTLVTTRQKAGEETTLATTNKSKGSQLYLNFGGGAEYVITRKIAFYLQPSLTVFAIKPDNKYHPATGKKYFPSVQTGIRYHF